MGTGAKVRLHIEGLGSPMKARVREGSARKVQVGSNLEFLKVGRKLELEDLDIGERRIANIDSVSVAIDPHSQVPQLVVTLRYDGQDVTPEPSVVDTSAPLHAAISEPVRRPSGHTSQASTFDPDAEEEFAADEVEDDPMLDRANAFAEKLGLAAEGAMGVAKSTGERLARVSSRMGKSAAQGLGKLMQQTGKQVSTLRRQGQSGPERKRSTALPPRGSLSLDARRLRPQSAPRGSVSQNAVPPRGASHAAGRGAVKAMSPMQPAPARSSSTCSRRTQRRWCMATCIRARSW
jgi:hypothetical protein